MTDLSQRRQLGRIQGLISFAISKHRASDHQDTGWIEAVLLNGWANYGAPFETVAFRKINGVVYIKGFTNSAGTRTAETSIFELPEGFRPEADKHQPVITDVHPTVPQRVKITAAGGFLVNDIPASTWVSFAGISYPADL